VLARSLSTDAALVAALFALGACSGSSGGSDGTGADTFDGGTSPDSGGSSPDSSTGSHDGGTASEGGGTHDSGTSSDASTDGGVTMSDGGSGLFANCSLSGGCLADCSPPADDPIATGNAMYDLYDGCILAGMAVAGMTEPWMGKILKSQAYNESGISPVVTTNDDTCGGQNCGIWAISAGSVSGDDPPGPCGSSSSDPHTGMVDYSHSYGLFQDTPACEGTFLQPTLPSGYTCTPTTEANNISFNTSITFYCESQTSIGVSTPSGTKKGYINAVQTTSDPLYATSIFNPAYQLYVYLDYTWGINFQQANAGANGCTQVQHWYLSLAYWLTGNATSSCTLTGDGLDYVKTAISDYETVLYNSTWPYPAP
jgi:hypothetical protein